MMVSNSINSSESSNSDRSLSDSSGDHVASSESESGDEDVWVNDFFKGLYPDDNDAVRKWMWAATECIEITPELLKEQIQKTDASVVYMRAEFDGHSIGRRAGDRTVNRNGATLGRHGSFRLGKYQRSAPSSRAVKRIAPTIVWGEECYRPQAQLDVSKSTLYGVMGKSDVGVISIARDLLVYLCMLSELDIDVLVFDVAVDRGCGKGLNTAFSIIRRILQQNGIYNVFIWLTLCRLHSQATGLKETIAHYVQHLSVVPYVWMDRLWRSSKDIYASNCREAVSGIVKVAKTVSPEQILRKENLGGDGPSKQQTERLSSRPEAKQKRKKSQRAGKLFQLINKTKTKVDEKQGPAAVIDADKETLPGSDANVAEDFEKSQQFFKAVRRGHLADLPFAIVRGNVVLVEGPENQEAANRFFRKIVYGVKTPSWSKWASIGKSIAELVIWNALSGRDSGHDGCFERHIGSGEVLTIKGQDHFNLTLLGAGILTNIAEVVITQSISISTWHTSHEKKTGMRKNFDEAWESALSHLDKESWGKIISVYGYDSPENAEVAEAVRRSTLYGILFLRSVYVVREDFDQDLEVHDNFLRTWESLNEFPKDQQDYLNDFMTAGNIRKEESFYDSAVSSFMVLDELRDCLLRAKEKGANPHALLQVISDAVKLRDPSTRRCEQTNSIEKRAQKAKGAWRIHSTVSANVVSRKWRYEDDKNMVKLKQMEKKIQKLSKSRGSNPWNVYKSKHWKGKDDIRAQTSLYSKYENETEEAVNDLSKEAKKRTIEKRARAAIFFEEYAKLQEEAEKRKGPFMSSAEWKEEHMRTLKRRWNGLSDTRSDDVIGLADRRMMFFPRGDAMLDYFDPVWTVRKLKAPMAAQVFGSLYEKRQMKAGASKPRPDPNSSTHNILVPRNIGGKTIPAKKNSSIAASSSSAQLLQEKTKGKQPNDKKTKSAEGEHLSSEKVYGKKWSGISKNAQVLIVWSTENTSEAMMVFWCCLRPDRISGVRIADFDEEEFELRREVEIDLHELCHYHFVSAKAFSKIENAGAQVRLFWVEADFDIVTVFRVLCEIPRAGVHGYVRADSDSVVRTATSRMGLRSDAERKWDMVGNTGRTVFNDLRKANNLLAVVESERASRIASMKWKGYAKERKR